MVHYIAESFRYLASSGGVVIWPLLAVSMLATCLILERCWFWAKTNRPRRRDQAAKMGQLLRRGQLDTARALAEADPSVYGSTVTRLLEEGASEDLVIDIVESQRARLERFMPTLSTIITTAPMLGILGTVFGIISSFQILSQQTTIADPKDVAAGIAEALLTTAAGLIIAIVVLFPYNIFRAQIDRTLGRIESLIAAAALDRPTDNAAQSPA